MVKQKKKSTQISSLDKTLGRIIGIEVQNPAEFRKLMDHFKQQYKERAEAYGLTGEPSDKPDVKDYAMKGFMEICSSDNVESYIYCVRELLAGYWNLNRVVYSFSKEVLDYIDNVLHLADFKVDMSQLEWMASTPPILIEAPPGSPVEKVFFGRVGFISDSMPNDEKGERPKFTSMISLLYNSDSDVKLLLTHGVRRPVSFVLNDAVSNQDEDAPGLSFAMKLVAFIGYMNSHTDGKELAFEETSIKNGVRYKVRIPQITGIMPDETKDSGWIRAGLAPLFAYLDRKNMLESFQKESGDPLEKIVLPVKEYDQALSDHFVRQLVIDWESSRNLYQFDDETAFWAGMDYAEGILAEGISTELLDYMPHDTIVLHPLGYDTDTASLISRCTLEGSIPGIFIATVIRNRGAGVYYFAENLPIIEGGPADSMNDVAPEILFNLCIFKHILTILHRKSIRKMANEPLPRPSWLESPPSKAESMPEPPVVRQGGDINDTIPITMYDLTKRAVKRVSQKEAARRGGWKVAPHTRRKHYHRYWVGKGENRHLEPRLLESMKINRGEKTPSVITHSVGL